MKLPLIAALGLLFATPALADWAQTLAEAKGQTVYFNAWGGDARTNAFIAWVGTQTEALYGVKVEQVKLTDTAEAVTRVISEKAAGEGSEGAGGFSLMKGAQFFGARKRRGRIRMARSI